jgi:hypothetical protein
MTFFVGGGGDDMNLNKNVDIKFSVYDTFLE